jgi:RHS repeat-associated protein
MSGYGFTNSGTTYDDEDRLTGNVRANGSLNQSWNLTTVGDWTSVTTNGTSQSRTHGPTHELLTAGGQNVSSDVKGNITLLPASLSSLPSTASSLSYDFDNKLKSVDVGNNSSIDAEYKYDALGRRVARVGSSGSFVYVQSDQQTIADYGIGDAPSTLAARYVFASYIDEPVVRKGTGTSGTIHYYHRNQQYSITAVTTSTGAVAERYAYSAYGEPTFLNSSGSPLTPQASSLNQRFTYTGREWDSTVGLYHSRARWMSPKSGRFLQRDPIGFEGSQWNTYAYVGARVFGHTDPLGLQECSDMLNCGYEPPKPPRNPFNGIGMQLAALCASCGMPVLDLNGRGILGLA